MRTKYGFGWLGTATIMITSMTAVGQGPSAPTRLIDSVEGPDLYKAYCAVCHGLDGHGDGPMKLYLKAKTPDLTRISERNRSKFPREKVERIITGQAPLPAGHGTSEMPVWGPVFSQVAWDRDLGKVRIHNLATYIEKMQVPHSESGRTRK